MAKLFKVDYVQIPKQAGWMSIGVINNTPRWPKPVKLQKAPTGKRMKTR